MSLFAYVWHGYKYAPDTIIHAKTKKNLSFRMSSLTNVPARPSLASKWVGGDVVMGLI